MRILILNNFFNYYSNNLPQYGIKRKIFSKYYNKYNVIKLKKLMNKLKKKYAGDVEFKIISSSNEKLNVNSNIDVELLSDFRIKIDRIEFIDIKEKIIKKAKQNFTFLFKNLLNLKTFHFNGIFIGKVIEFEVLLYFKKVFGEFEILKKILQYENYDKVIFFNYNPNYSELIYDLSSNFGNIKAFQDILLLKVNKLLKFYNIYFLILILRQSLKSVFFKKKNTKTISKSKRKKIVILIGKKLSKGNIFKTIKPIYECLKKYDNINPIYYHIQSDFLPLNKINDLIKFLLQIRKICRDNKHKILMNLEYDSFKLDNVLKEFYSHELFFYLILIFSSNYHFNQFIKKYPPSVVIKTAEASMSARHTYKVCLQKKIPTIYVPHASIPCYKDIITKPDATFITVSGENEKNYLLSRGVPERKIVLTGRMSYESFYKGNINALTEIKDMFDKRIYKFEPNKSTILLTTNPLNDEINEKILSTVIQSLKELELSNNLIIKLHPQENGIIHKKTSQKFNINPIIVKNYNILELMKSSDLILANRSTSALECLMIGKPVIILDVANFNFLYNIKKYEERYLIVTNNQHILTEKIGELISNLDYYNKYVTTVKEQGRRYSFYDENESATEKIINLILRIIKNNK